VICNLFLTVQQGIVIALRNAESFQIFRKIKSLIAFESPISNYTTYYTALVKKNGNGGSVACLNKE